VLLLVTLNLVPREREVGPLSEMRRRRFRIMLIVGFLFVLLLVPRCKWGVGPLSEMTAATLYVLALLDFYSVTLKYRFLRGWEVGPPFGAQRSTLATPYKLLVNVTFRLPLTTLLVIEGSYCNSASPYVPLKRVQGHNHALHVL